MPREIGFERGQITDVVHALLETPHKTRREAHPLNAQPLQLRSKVDVLGVGSRLLCFVYRDFQLKGLPPRTGRQMSVHCSHMGKGSPVLGRGPQQSAFVKYNGSRFEFDYTAL